MTRPLESIVRAMDVHAEAPAIICLREDGAEDVISYRELERRARSIACTLARGVHQGGSVGLVASNSAEWIAADLALLMGHFVEVPVPLGFTVEQASHLVSACDVVLVDDAGRQRFADWARAADSLLTLPCMNIAELQSDSAGPLPEAASEDWICKIIHTSGTTNQPKGVRIRAEALSATLSSLLTWTQPADYARYLNLVPFSLLLEQLTALYLPFARGGCVVLAPPGQLLVGDLGASLDDKLALIRSVAPSALTLTPSLVERLRTAANAIEGVAQPERNRVLFGRDTPPLLAAGGGPVARSTLEELAAAGIDVLVGYGLSETSSVVCWNPRHANHIGTVGLPLPGVSCRVAADGELGVRTASLFAGYLGDDPSACAVDAQGWLWTGDIASIDESGYVSITGRKKNLIVTAHGRNVAPEFVEASYCQVAGVKACVVFGDSDNALSALVILDDGADAVSTERALSAHGATHLSSVERVEHFYVMDQSTSPLADLFTLTGRPRRELVAHFLREHWSPNASYRSA